MKMIIKHLNNLIRGIARHKGLILIILTLIILFKMCTIRDTYEVFIPEYNVHYKLERFGDYARLYVSHTDTFGADYIEFNHTPIFFPKFYYVDPDTLYFIDDGGWYFRSIKDQHFIIKKIDLVRLPKLGPAVEDSVGHVIITTPPDYFKKKAIRDEQEIECKNIQERATNTIHIGDYASGITVFGSHEIVAEDHDAFVLAGH